MGAHSRPETNPSPDQGSLFDADPHRPISKEEGNARLQQIREDVANRNQDYAMVFHDRRISNPNRLG